MKNSTVEETRFRVQEVVKALSPIPQGDVTSASRLAEDLGYDSLALVELALALEDEFDLEPMEGGEETEFATVGDIERLIVAGLGLTQ